MLQDKFYTKTPPLLVFAPAFSFSGAASSSGLGVGGESSHDDEDVGAFNSGLILKN